MNYGEYGWQSLHWPLWRYNLAALAKPMIAVSRAQEPALLRAGQSEVLATGRYYSHE